MRFLSRIASNRPTSLSMFCEQLEQRFMLNGSLESLGDFLGVGEVESEHCTALAHDIGLQTADSSATLPAHVAGIIFSRSARAADDGFEQNDTRATAANLGTPDRPTTMGNLVLADASDWYKFNLKRAPLPTEKIIVVFKHADGNLNAVLVDAAGQAIKSFNSTTNNETIGLQGLSVGIYFLRVFGANGKI